MQSTESAQNGGGDIISGLVEDFLGTLSPDMSKQLSGILTEDMGLSKMETEKFIRYQRQIHSQRMILGKDKKPERILGPRYQWIKELATDTADQLALFAVGCLLSNRTARMKRIREKVLDHLCDVTGENTTVENATTRVERILVVVADRMATWIDETISNIESKMKPICVHSELLEVVPGEEMSTLSSETWSTTESEEDISKTQSDISAQAESGTASSIESIFSEELKPEEQEDVRLSQESQKRGKPTTDEISMKTKEEVDDYEDNENQENTGNIEEAETDEDKTTDLEESDKDDDKTEASSDNEEVLTTEKSEEDVTGKSTDDEDDASVQTDTVEEESESEDEKVDKTESTESGVSESSEGPDSEEKDSEEDSSTEEIRTVKTRSEPSVKKEEEKKLPTDILELLKEDITRLPKGGEKSDRQKAMRKVIDKRFEEIAKEMLEKSLDSLTKCDIEEAASVLANWVENLLSSTDRIPGLPDVPSYPGRQGPAFEIKRGFGSQYKVHKLSSTTVAQKVAQIRGVELPLRKQRIPRTTSPINLESANDWADWALGTANIGEEWGKWLDATLTDVEQKLTKRSGSRAQIDKHSEWKDWRDSKEREAQKWRVERQRIKQEGMVWNRKLQKQNTQQPEKETNVLNY